MKPDYDKVGLLVVRSNHILLCRKKHTTALLILPGGCYEPGESAAECLNRELEEELGNVRVENLKYVGTYTDQAAGPGAKTVRIELYQGNLIGDPAPHSEIRELIWFGPEDDQSQLSPSIKNKILPDLKRRQILP